jgi:hypothetical protein
MAYGYRFLEVVLLDFETDLTARLIEALLTFPFLGADLILVFIIALLARVLPAADLADLLDFLPRRVFAALEAVFLLGAFDEVNSFSSYFITHFTLLIIYHEKDILVI